MQDVTAVELGGSTADFSIMGMFMGADLIVQAVMILLIVASIWGWTIIFATSRRVRGAGVSANKFEENFWSGTSLDDLYVKLKNRPDHPMAAVFVSAMREWQRSLSKRSGVLDRVSVQDRIYRVMKVTSSREMDFLEGQVGYLATIGSAAPFVGLFGTVWGIMNSFQSIAQASDTSLAVVAPGIAEALLATALGLVAAIPAVVAYNKLSTDLGRYAGRLEDFTDEFAAILSRQLDEETR